jgi:hypothetical protein
MFSVNVVIPQLDAGLFSYGVQVILPSGKAASDSIVVPPPLNFNGVLGPGALKQMGADVFGVKGTIDFDAIAAAYEGALIGTFNIKNLVTTVGESYPLTLDFFRTLGPNETLFVDGTGTALDPRITFGSAMIVIVPEPSVLALLAIPLAWKIFSHRAVKVGVGKT